MKRHNSQFHPQEGVESIDHDETDLRTSEGAMVLDYVCFECKNIFKRISDLETHLLRNHSENYQSNLVNEVKSENTHNLGLGTLNL